MILINRIVLIGSIQPYIQHTMSYSKDILDALIETNKATMIGDFPALKKNLLFFLKYIFHQ